LPSSLTSPTYQPGAPVPEDPARRRDANRGKDRVAVALAERRHHSTQLADHA
jgi:hypothetical protein